MSRYAIAAAPLALFLLALIMAACSTEPSADEPDAPPAVGDAEVMPAPDFELVTFSNEDHAAGEVVKLSQFSGQPVVLNFWFPSCPPCVAEMPDFETVYQKFKSEDVQFIGVQLLGLDTAEDGQEFVEKLGVNYILGPDQTETAFGQIVKGYRVSGFPTTVFIDRDHNITRTWSGALNAEDLEELVRELL